MPSQHRFITTGGTTIWFATKPTAYTGAGTPWTSQSSTPFQIAMNAVTGPIWTPKPPDPQTQFGGGGVFRHGASPVYSSFPNVTEDIPIQVKGSSHDNAVAAYRALRNELMTALASGPIIFVFQPDGASNAVLYEVSSAMMAENPISLNQEAGRFLLRAVISITRQPFGGTTSLSTISGLNAQTVVNNSTTGTNPNSKTLGTLLGDMPNYGTPLNITITPVSSSATWRRLLLATIASRSTSSTTASSTTSSTSGVNITSRVFTAAAAQTNALLKPRLLLRFSNLSANAEVRIRVLTGEPGLGETTIYTSPWVAGLTTGANLLDMGTWSFHYLRAISAGNTSFSVYIDGRSTSGASTTINLDYTELLLYYDFCQVDYPQFTTLIGNTNADGLRQPPNGPYLPRYPAYVYVTAPKIQFVCPPVRGTFPRGFAGSSIWVSWYEAGWDHDKTATAQLTVKYAPLYLTVRGAG